MNPVQRYAPLKRRELTSYSFARCRQQISYRRMNNSRNKSDDGSCLPLQILESRLKIILPEDLSEALSNGTVLCQLVNQIKPRSVLTINVPSPAVVSISNFGCSSLAVMHRSLMMCIYIKVK